MITPQSKGFTLVEVVVVIAIIGILAALAGPSMFNLIRSNQLQQEARDFVAVLNEARSEAILKRTTVYVGNKSNKSTREIVYSEWAPKRADAVEWEIKPRTSTPFAFDFMGRVNVAYDPQCFILRHKHDTSLKAVIFVYKQGVIRYMKDKNECPTGTTS